MFFFKKIHFIVHEELFKNRFYCFVFGDWLQQIKTGSHYLDVSGIKEIIKLRGKKNIGIYPEGDIGFFGDTLPYAESIAKLLKKMKMPIALLTISGGYLRAARWENYYAKARLEYSLNDVISVNELESMSDSELSKRIHQGINHDDMAYQEKNHYIVNRKNPAEALEYCLFLCPKCHEYETMHSENDRFYCTKCGYEVKMDSTMHFVTNQENHLYFDTASKWNSWQITQLKERKNLISHDNQIIAEANNLDSYYAEEGDSYRKDKNDCTLKLYCNRIEIIPLNSDETKTIYFSDMIVCRVQFRGTLEIDTRTYRYRFGRPKDGVWSAYYWVQTINTYKQ